MIFELVNPSDKITFVGEDKTIAAVACMILGKGTFGLHDDKGERVCSIFWLGGHEEWLKEHGINDLPAYMRANAVALADFLDTALYRGIDMRVELDESLKRMIPQEAAEHRAWWNDRHRQRTSMSQIVDAAYALAKRLREIGEKEEAKPTGVTE